MAPMSPPLMSMSLRFMQAELRPKVSSVMKETCVCAVHTLRLASGI
jgi:hypothetical protein